ncbi:aminomethyltransferase family protein [uncultured Peptoniphilus sp.]|uniref:aminomethyltransferase family protein n=1 Tax=uncultured Peptoniphilus sp. TaxID=254354 RepID=UPI002589EAA0|nr:aminomethyltransferase family protein [uncultured Peptoniphilus sp.]MDU6783709.1 aminomethyltransferase family protein [Peptoniphilus harei]
MKNDVLRRKEHEAVRKGVGYYDFTHQVLDVKGRDAATFLDKVFVNDIKNMKEGHALYTTMLNEDGKIIDDVIVFRLEENKFLISTLYIDKMIKWFDKFKDGCDLDYKDITSKLTMFAIQGPKSKDLVNKIVDKDISSMKFFTIDENTVGDLDIMVARAGFTGELGYELYVESDKKEKLEEKIKKAGEEFGLVNITTDVIIGSLPGEKGYVLMSDLEGTNPLEVGYGFTVHWDSDFIGKDALLKAKEDVKRDLFGFELDGEAEVEAGDPVFCDGKEIGKVTKFTYGYTLEKFIGYCLIEKDLAVEGKVVEIKTKSGNVKAKLCERVFYDKENERVRG